MYCAVLHTLYCLPSPVRVRDVLVPVISTTLLALIVLLTLQYRRQYIGSTQVMHRQYKGSKHVKPILHS